MGVDRMNTNKEATIAIGGEHCGYNGTEPLDEGPDFLPDGSLPPEENINDVLDALGQMTPPYGVLKSVSETIDAKNKEIERLRESIGAAIDAMDDNSLINATSILRTAMENT